MTEPSIVCRNPGRIAARALLPLAAALLLSACQTTGPVVSGQAEARAEALTDQDRHADAARIYIALAGDARDDERVRLTLLAIDAWLRAGDVPRARTAFETIGAPTDPALINALALTAARLDLAAGNPASALERLAAVDGPGLSVEQRLELEALRGSALFDTGAPLEALRLLVRRELWLDDAAGVSANHEIIWAGLIGSDTGRLQSALSEAEDPVVRGWLALGIAGAGAGEDSLAFRSGIADWRRNYPGHPALADLVPSLLGADVRLVDYPRQIGVLLPLSGRNSAPATAIRDGILGAYYNDFRGELKPLVRLYDVSQGSSADVYRQAVADGAQFVIGPLLKNSVTEIATTTDVVVPTLALNMLPDEVTSPPGLYQFALAPEDEADEVGDRAILDERPRAVALVPRSEWGDRVLNAFAASLQAGGGRLLDYRRYEAGSADFSATIRSLLLIDESMNRYRELRSTIGRSVQFEPRLRGDIDFIFLGADGATARLLRPQIRFHYAGDEPPIYATSAVNARDGRADADLNGILFPEIPWIISERSDIADIRSLYATLWQGSDRLARLYAMGYDAYRLVGELQRPEGAFSAPVEGLTGELSMDPQGRIHRRLPFARFEAGEPVPVPEPEPVFEDLELPPGREILLQGGRSGDAVSAWPAPGASE